jgi:hypothetical protein
LDAGDKLHIPLPRDDWEDVLAARLMCRTDVISDSVGVA